MNDLTSTLRRRLALSVMAITLAGLPVIAQSNTPAQPTVESYRQVLQDASTTADEQAKARLGLARLLVTQGRPEEAARTIEPIFTLDVSANLKHEAQRDALRALWGKAGWNEPGDLTRLRQAIDAMLTQGDTWPDRARRALEEAGNLTQRSQAYHDARQYYEKALALPDLKSAQRIALLRRVADTYRREGRFDLAQQTWQKALAVQGITPALQAGVMRDQAHIYTAPSQRNDAQALLERALALEGLTDALKADLLSDLALRHAGAFDLPALSAVVDRLLALKNAPARIVAPPLVRQADLAEKNRNLPLAQQAYERLIALPASQTILFKTYPKLARLQLMQNQMEQARQTLASFRDTAQHADIQLVCELQIAVTYLADRGAAAVRKEVERLLEANDKLPASQRISALWDAAKLFADARLQAPARLLIEVAQAQANPAVKRYAVKPVDRAPAGAGGWALSDLLKDPQAVDRRFYPYNRQDAAELLAVDVSAERPFGDGNANPDTLGQTALAMVYDTRGWHLCIKSDEPAIDRILTQGGQGASSLEMFFTPGLTVEPYYQWIIGLADQKVSVYNWHSPHRHYRPLDDPHIGLQTSTVATADGWVTVVTIPWEAMYDKLPFLPGNGRVWRFSMQRWNPAGSVTWGGRVHETGRWGQIVFEQPSPAQQTAILRHLIRRAWWRYDTTMQEQTTFWTGRRGDQAFHQEMLVPLIEREKNLAAELDSLDQWSADKVHQFFHDHVARWMEIRYHVDDLRTAYLQKTLLASQP